MTVAALKDKVCLGKAAPDIARLDDNGWDHQVALGAVDAGSAGLQGLLGIKDGRQHFVLDRNELEGILGHIFADGCYGSHAIAQETGFVSQDVLIAG